MTLRSKKCPTVLITFKIKRWLERRSQHLSSCPGYPIYLTIATFIFHSCVSSTFTSVMQAIVRQKIHDVAFDLAPKPSESTIVDQYDHLVSLSVSDHDPRSTRRVDEDFSDSFSSEDYEGSKVENNVLSILNRCISRSRLRSRKQIEAAAFTFQTFIGWEQAITCKCWKCQSGHAQAAVVTEDDS